MRHTPCASRTALGAVLVAGLAGVTLPRAAAADASPGTGPARIAPTAPVVAAPPAAAVLESYFGPAVRVPLAAEPAHNALRLDLRGTLNAWELSYERALTRRIGLFAGATIPISLHRTIGTERVSGLLWGGTLGARFYPVGGDSTFSGLTLSPFVDATFARGAATAGDQHRSRSLTVWGAGATVGYSWTPGDFMVIAAGLGAQVIIAPQTTAVLPIFTLGVGPTF